MNISNLTSRKRMRGFLFIFILAFTFLIIRLAYLQLIDNDKLVMESYEQQTRDRVINSKRGTIYDCTGKKLAVSASVETVTVEPKNIAKQDKEKISQGLSKILELDYETVNKKVSKNTSIETIAKKIEKEKADELRQWLQKENITKGVNIDEDSKRYYPYNKLASNIIGFCGSDNQGLEGLEKTLDEYLKGKSGRIIATKDATGKELPATSEKYVDPEAGYDVVLTIDQTIQSITEKYLDQAVKENDCKDGGAIVVMDPRTGDILAMASSNGYDLNSPFEPNKEEVKAVWDTLDQKEKNEALQKMWRNPAVADTYEPGSTFKIITTSIALEEGLTQTDREGEFNCSGSIQAAKGVSIKCWRFPRTHGSQSLRKGLMNSCNPVFITLGKRIGVTTFYKYLRNFGFFDKTGVNLTGDTKGIFFDENKVGDVELATLAFGQRFQITPLQLANAACAIANGGNLMKPRIVKEIRNSNGDIVEEVKPEVYRRVISEQTSKDVLSMMTSVVDEGTGKNARVQGYQIGGKTGTAEVGVKTNKYTASFLGIAPTSSPRLVILVCLFDPKGVDGHQGGGIAAPVAGKIMTEVLKYLEIPQDFTYTEEEKENVVVPEIRNLTLKEAKQKLTALNLKLEVSSLSEEYDEENSVVLEQIPKPGVTILSDGVVTVNI